MIARRPGSFARCASGVLAAVCAACGDPAARVKLVPIELPNQCNQATAPTALRVIAYGPTGEVNRPASLTGAVDISDFPADTEQLGVEVLGGNQGDPIREGKTAPLAFGALTDGTVIPIAMLPPDGFCRTGDLTEVRQAPVVMRAGPGVLVLGGKDATGAPLATAEYYDPATATFSPIALPSGFVTDASNGLAGAALAELTDGRVSVTGTARSAYTYFGPDAGDPSKLAFTSTGFLTENRSFHAAIAADPTHVFVIGGCAQLIAGACDPASPKLRSSFSYTLDFSSSTPGPILANGASRIGAQLSDLGVEADGVRRFVLAGGSGDPGVADRFAIEDRGATEQITGLAAQVAVLDGGVLLTAFAPDGMPQLGSVVALGPSEAAPTTLPQGPLLDGARLVVAEDGSAIAIGGDPQGGVTVLDPTSATWHAIAATGAAADRPVAVNAPTLVRLDDGSVLVLGATAAGVATASAWLYRPSLIGPASAQIDVGPLPGGTHDAALTPSDPAAVTRPGGHLVVTAPDDSYGARVLIGGPRIASGALTVVLQGTTLGGVALIAQQVSPGRALIGRFVPGEAARIDRQVGTSIKTACSGQVIDAGQLALPLGLTISGSTATLAVGPAGAAMPVATCDLSGDPELGNRGLWGIAPAGAGAKIDISTVHLTRAP